MSKSPWVKFYASDWIGGTSGLTAAERGVYITIVALIYENDGPVKMDEARMARQCGITKASFRKAVSALIDVGKLIETDDGLMNDRCEKELSERANRAQKASVAASQKWSAKKQKNEKKQRQKTANASAKQCLEDAYTRSQKPEDIEANASCPEPEKSAPVACRLPLVSGEEFDVLESDVSEWCEAFPAVDVRQQLRAMRAWLNANPNKRKTARGIKRFIVSWLDREQNRPRGPSMAPLKHHRDSFRQAIRELSGSARNEPDQPDTRHDNHGDSRTSGTGSGTVIDLLAVPGRR